MKRNLLSLLFLAICFAGFSTGWVGINSPIETPAKIALISSDIERSVVHFTLDGFSTREVVTPRGKAQTIILGESSQMLEAGSPELPKLTTSLIIPDKAGMSVRILSSSYRDFNNMEIAPSKGVIMRNVDPETVPYQYNSTYFTDRFFPGEMAGTREPFIIRDLRGQTLIVYPFQYNPVTKVLRVYYDLTVELYKISEKGSNDFDRHGKEMKISRDFSPVYDHAFLNSDVLDYTPLDDYGKMLVICHDAFMPDMEPFVKWKNSIGIPTEMISKTTAGSSAAAIKSYITNYYNTNGLTFVLLVGDAAQIPTNSGSGLGGPSDNAYGYIVGNDHYSDVYIGRFSAETAAHVQTQVERTINYEKNPQLRSDDWYTTVIGIASNQGPGDDNEYDYQHIRNQQTQLLAYTYTWNPELFDGSQGGNDASGNPSPSQVATAVNEGSSLIIYCGHGSTTSWGTSGFSNSNVNSLTNQEKLPFIWSVACVNGEFMNGTCFAEAWLRATKDGQPTGAIAFLGSTINQSWNSPMEGQDEMTDILAESYTNNIKRTFGGLSINGCMKMIDSYGADGKDMADTWTIFGDPSLIVRTDNPDTLVATHETTLFVGSTAINVACAVENARATATLNDVILATGLVTGGTVTLTFPALPTPNDTVHLVVTAYNNIPYITDIPVVTTTGPYILYTGNTINDATGDNNHLADYGEDILLTIALKNVGVAATSALNVKIVSNDPYFILNDSTENYGIIDPGQEKAITDAYAFHVKNNIPDGHAISFQLVSVDDTLTWNSQFTITGHAPVLQVGNLVIVDPTGNGNGKLDPGETVQLQLYINNAGSSTAFGVEGNLISACPFVTITDDQQSFGDIAAGGNAYKTFTLMVSNDAPQGQSATFLLEISAAKDIFELETFDLIIGKIPVLIVDLDANNNSGPEMHNAIQGLGMFADYNSTGIPDSLDQYTSIFITLGVYGTSHVLTTAEGQKLADYLLGGGRLYMEGGDTWAYDPSTPVHQYFMINGIGDGSGDLGTLLGQSGTFTEDMVFSFGGDNSYIDHISPMGSAFSVFKNQNPNYFTTIAYDGGTYRTIGSSAEFGGMTDAAYPSTKQHLMEEYLNFFGMMPPPLVANFIGYPTNILPGADVNFMDFSSGGVNSWQWSFPGGNPSTSTEENPVVNYPDPGLFDVRLIVGNGADYDTLIKQEYIQVDYATYIERKGDMCITVHPNPSIGNFEVKVNSSQNDVISFRIYDLMGNTVYEENEIVLNGAATRIINLTSRPDGIYFLVVKGKNSLLTEKLIIRK